MVFSYKSDLNKLKENMFNKQNAEDIAKTLVFSEELVTEICEQLSNSDGMAVSSFIYIFIVSRHTFLQTNPDEKTKINLFEEIKK